MKRTLLLLSVSILAIASLSKAQTLNNPKDGDGYYIVKWDCAQDAFAASNDVEADETFTFAVDVTGTPFEAWLKETPTAEGATRALAINKWTNFGDVSGGTNRLKQIRENVFAATWNIHQMATGPDLIANAVMEDSVVYIYGQVFGFEFTNDNPGAGWWMWPAEIEAGTAIDPGTGAIFRTLAYTGTKTGEEFYSDDYEGGLFLSNNIPEKGYSVPCAYYTAISDELVNSDAAVIAHEYYNILGVKLNEKPKTGLYIHKKLKADNTFEVSKEYSFGEF
jgi:hypothetical protein